MAHTHPSAFTIGNESAHTHEKGTIAAAAEATHTHTKGTFAVGAHQHLAPVGYEGSKGIEITEDFGTVSETHQVSWTPRDAYEERTADWFKTKTETPGFSGTSSAGSSHTHVISGSSAAGSAHNHSISGNTGAASNSENRPKYLSCFYIMRVV